MTADEFRRIALSVAGVTEGSFNGYPDFRVDMRAIASLGYPSDEWATVKLNADDQAKLIAARPDVFTPTSGAWGKLGSTLISLPAADKGSVRKALEMAAVEPPRKPRPKRRRRKARPAVSA